MLINRQRRQFERLIVPMTKPLYIAALRLCRQHDWAEDLVQDTLIRAYERFNLFQPGTNFRAWLLTILTRLYLNDYVRGKRRPLSISYEEMGPSGSAMEFAAPTGENPETLLISAVIEEELQIALDSIQEDFRQALILVDLEELSYQEAAEALSIPVGTVRSRVSRGRTQLRQHLMKARDNATKAEIGGQDTVEHTKLQ